ncbi:MAG TPA: DSD1 family PLP-dependent enzyme [Casimicrobiaceae bacterium]|nr:DSD1 family PLP-dependent enzyme [Casimicrobiaceae bacterium]
MPQSPPARVGDPLAAVDTPALVLDLDAFSRNIDRLANSAHGVRLRPHAKAHKCPDIARLQIAAGAVGVCCQKTDEAAVFVDAGIADVLVTNEVVAPAKIARLAELASRATVGVLTDDVANILALSEAATQAAVVLDVYVEIDVGAHRCGVAPGAPAVALAQEIAVAPGLRFRGLHAYHGGAQHLREPDERAAAIAAAGELARETRDAIEISGLHCAIVTGAGTGTWHHERDSGVWTELQPGSYVFMDADYRRNTLSPDEMHFEQSLFVLAGVMSVAAPGRAVVDAGLKAFALDSGLPVVHDRGGTTYVKATDEHGVLELDATALPVLRNDRIWLIPGHCDPTVNLYDWIVGFRRDRVEAIWSVAARGALG